VRIIHRLFACDVEAVADAIAEAGLPGAIAGRLTRGR